MEKSRHDPAPGCCIMAAISDFEIMDILPFSVSDGFQLINDSHGIINGINDAILVPVLLFIQGAYL